MVIKNYDDKKRGRITDNLHYVLFGFLDNSSKRFNNFPHKILNF